MAFRAVRGQAPSIVNTSVHTRRYLTEPEVERLMATSRKIGRYGHRDATMILIAYRHGLRASELCDLQWHQVELNAGRCMSAAASGARPASIQCRATKSERCGGYSASRARRRMSLPPSAAAR